jgi:hypothetical protein
MGFPQPLFGGSVYAWDTWPNSTTFLDNQPTTRYLGLHKPQGVTVLTGIAIGFDDAAKGLGFQYRRPGTNASATALINIIFYNTLTNGWSPVSTDSVTASTVGGWFTYVADPALEFNWLTLVSTKKFAIDDLTYTSTAVPVPATLLLFGSGLFLLARRRFRRS